MTRDARGGPDQCSARRRHETKNSWTRREFLKYSGLGSLGVLASQVFQTDLTSTWPVPVGASPGFALKGTIVTLNTLCQGALNFQCNGWRILQDLGVNVIAVAAGIEGDVAHFNMNNYPNDWPQRLDGFLSLAEEHGIRVIFKQLGNQYGTLFDIVSPQPKRGIVGTPIDFAKQMIDMLAGDNLLRLNFITDPRILAWSVANEVDMGDPTTRDWCIDLLDYIRLRGGVAYMGSPYDSRASTDSTPDLAFDFHILEPTLRGHVDYLECHIYGLDAVLNAAMNGMDLYEATYDTFIQRLRTLMINGRGSFPLNKLILGEFGIWHGVAKGSRQVIRNFDDNQRAAYYMAVYRAAYELGLYNTFNMCCFDEKYEDGTYLSPAYGIVDTDGTFYTGCTSVLQYYYKSPVSVRSRAQ